MTTYELERDLKSLAEPQEADERLRLAIRTQLGERRQVSPGRFRRRRALGAAALAAAAVAAALMLIGTGGSGGPGSADAAISSTRSGR